MFRINHLTLPWKSRVAFDGSESVLDGGESLDDIAKTLILNPKEPPKAAKEPPKAAPEPPDDVEDTDESDDTPDEAPEDTPEDTQDDESESDEASDQSDDASDDPEDIDEIEIDVVVDGETKSVKLKDLKARYSGAEAIDKRLQEVSEIKTKVVTTGNALYKVLTEQAQRLAAMDEFVQQQINQPVNWEELRVKDPGKYLLERERVRELEDQQRRIQEENYRVSAQKAELDNLAYQEYATEQLKAATHRIPEFRDPVKTKEVMQDIAMASKYYGFSEQELNAVVDHRQLMVLVDAARYRKSVAEKAGKGEAKKLEMIKARPLVKVGTTSQKANAMSSAKKDQLAAIKRAKATGSVDDVAKMLMVRK